ncbi:MAG: signal peptidase I [Patescibacteria group bacterium]
MADKIFRKIPTILEGIVLVVLLSAASLLVLSKADTPLNLRAFSVESGSMEPEIRKGSIVFVRAQDNYSEGDVVTYQARGNPNNTFTHRIVEVKRDEDINKTSYQTKGDANEDPDPGVVDSGRVLGKVFFTLPFFGYLVTFAKTQLGFILLVVIPGTIIVFSELQNIRKNLTALLSERKKTKNVKEA